MTTLLCLKGEIILLQYLRTPHLAPRSFLFLLQAKTLVQMLRLPISSDQGMRKGSSGLTQKQVCKVALTCSAKLKHQKNMNALGKALGPKDFQGQRLTACHCVINYTVKKQF